MSTVCVTLTSFLPSERRWCGKSVSFKHFTSENQNWCQGSQVLKEHVFTSLHPPRITPSLYQYRPAWLGNRDSPALLPLSLLPDPAMHSKAPEKKGFIRSGHRGSSYDKATVRILLLGPSLQQQPPARQEPSEV